MATTNVGTLWLLVMLKMFDPHGAPGADAHQVAKAAPAPAIAQQSAPKVQGHSGGKPAPLLARREGSIKPD